MHIGERIKQRRKEIGMSADKLAEKLGKDRSTVYRYEKGDIENLPLDILVPIAEALRTTPQFLMGWEEEQKENPAIEDGISEKRQKLIDFAKTVPEDKVELVLKLMRTIVEDAQ